jgi:multicomponent Na+:H+ antiporter subunit D
MGAQGFVLLAVAAPIAGALLIGLLHRRPNLREAATIAASLVTFFAVIRVLPDLSGGGRPSVALGEVMPGLAFRFEVEPLGMMFALVASFLWIVTSFYSIGYMRGHGEQNQTRFYACFAIAIASALGVAFAGNMLTLFVAYEALTLSTYPLVTHHQTPEAMRAGRTYLGILLSTSIGLQLVAILWTWDAAGTLDFTPGGILAGKVEESALPVLLALYVFGIGKAALMPLHRWLPAAMVAPTPVSALLHAVAVVKAGVFAVLKVIVYVFGLENLRASGATEWLMYVAAFTIIAASIVALTKDNLKARLAYSTVSQLSYVVLGAALATTSGVVGAAMHIAMHAFGKITLFFCAGAILVATHKTEVSQLAGLGRRMPFTFCAFLVGALSVTGLPPLGGAWSKWYLGLGAFEAEHAIFAFVFMASTLLNVGYLLPIAARGFFLPAAEADAVHAAPPGTLARVSVGAAAVEGGARLGEAPALCVVPLCLTAAGCLALFVFADNLYRFLLPLAAP